MSDGESNGADAWRYAYAAYTVKAEPYTITSGRLWDGDLLATYRRARAQVVDAIAAGLRDAGLTDEATIERLTEAVVKRLGEGV